MNTELAAIVFKEDIHKKLAAVLGKCLVIDSAVFLVRNAKFQKEKVSSHKQSVFMK